MTGFIFYTGCIGFNVPQPFSNKPYTYFKGGAQFGRDQLANRFLVAEKLVPIKGMEGNEILTILGQPQDVQILEKNVSEDWYFSYYKRYKTWPNTDQGKFLVRLYHNKVIDVSKI